MTLPLSYSRLRASRFGVASPPRATFQPATDPDLPSVPTSRRRGERGLPPKQTPPPKPSSPLMPSAERCGGEGRVRTSVATRAADLQSAAIDRSATSPLIQLRIDGFTNSTNLVNFFVGVRVFGVSVKTRRGDPVELAEGFEPPTG